MNNKLHGRRIRFDNYGKLYIQYLNQGENDVGKYIDIDSNGEICAGEMYLSKQGKVNWRGTSFSHYGSSS